MKIVNYNSLQVFNHIPLLRELGIIDSKFSDDYIEMFSNKKCNKFLVKDTAFIDRTGAIEHFLPLINIDPIPKIEKNFTKSWEELCEKRAIEFLNTGKKIHVWWSGGIDSTTVLFSLINKANDLSQINVILTPESIIESGSIFDYHIKNKISYNIQTQCTAQYFFSKYNFYTETDLLVTGCLSDQIDLSPFTGSFIGSKDYKLHKLPYEQVLEKYFDKKCIDFFNKSINNFPIKITTYAGFLRFIIFNYMWTSRKTFVTSKPKMKNNKNYPKLDSFFDTKDFQLFHLSNNDYNLVEYDDIEDKQKEHEIWRNYKKSSLNLIYKYTNNKEYFNKKTKSDSTSFVNSKSDSNIFLLENGETVSLNDLVIKAGYEPLDNY